MAKMKTLACADFGESCDFVAKGRTDQEVLDKMIEHVRTDHPEKFNQMKDPTVLEEMAEMIQEEI